MGKYIIIGIRSVSFGSYPYVLQVITRKKKGFFTSLFSSKSEFNFILSKESPFAKEAQAIWKTNGIWNVNEGDYRTRTLHGIDYLIELNIARYEKIIADKKAEEEKKRQLQEEKERERREEERLKKEKDEREHKLKEALDNATVRKISLSQFQMDVDTNAPFTEQMAVIAGNANMSFLTRNEKGFVDSVTLLYNMVHGYNSHKLKSIKPNDGQCIGLAFIKMAIYFTNGDFQVNEIAAQNAYYCIIKNYKETENTYALPALFTLLIKKPETLEDELFCINPNPALAGLGRVLPSAPYIRSRRAKENRLPIMKFLLEKFYDENSKRFIIDTTIPYHIPTEQNVLDFIKEFDNSDYSKNDDVLSLGEDFINKLYDNIDNQLEL